MSTPGVVYNRKSPTDATLHVYGVIGSEVTTQSVAEALREAAGVATLRVFVDSPGGDLMAGKAIYAQLSRFAQSSRVIAHVDGLAASAASFLIMAAHRIVMAPEATMMIHEARSFTGGTAADLRKMADVLEAETENLVSIYSKRTGRDAGEIRAMLAEETWMSAEEAVSAGFADEILEEEKPRPRAESPAVVTAQARVQEANRAMRLSVQWAEVERIRRKLSNMASHAGSPGQPGSPEVKEPKREN